MMTSMQLALPITLNNSKTFANFCVGDNQLLIDSLNSELEQKKFGSFFIYAREGEGKTHLLNAICSQAHLQGKNICYIPLSDYKMLSIDILSGFDEVDMICLDDIDAIANQRLWESAIFDLFNRLKEKDRAKLILTAQKQPKQIIFSLPDLLSRLLWGHVFELKEPNDEQKITVLQHFAKEKGFDFPCDVAQFVLTHNNRNMKILNQLLNKLDEASISQHRKITIPFVKTILNQEYKD